MCALPKPLVFSHPQTGMPRTALRSFGTVLCLAIAVALTEPAVAQRQMENLTRGIVAVKLPDGGAYVSWRLLGTEPEAIGFNLYRAEGSREAVKLNATLISGSTNFVDAKADTNAALRYFVRPVIGGRELEPSKPVPAWENDYLEIPIQPIPEYRPGDASVADLDGDGEYEIVLHQTSRPRDNSHTGITGTPILDAYKLDGTHMWRIDLGINIRDGEHYTQFMVYDLDGDGRAEIACKTADGTTDGQGKVIGDKTKDWRIKEEGSRRYGRILDGPEYFTIFDGQTGAALKTVDYIPNREPINGWGGIGGNGGNDDYGNRCDRFLACVAYLDGQRPSVIMCRGVYGRTVLAAWDWRDGELTSRWVFDSGSSYPPFENASIYSGMGGHSLSVADVDEDGKDEIVYHAMVIDDDGKGLYSTGLRHGDSMHISDMDPDRPGLEVFTVHENEAYTVRFNTPGAAMRDARTGELLWSRSPSVDVGAGLAADIDPRHPGYEAWGGPGGLRDCKGQEIGPKPRATGFAVWWDGDLLRELMMRSDVFKWNWEEGREEPLFATEARGGRRGPNLVGDLLGDWREELLMTAPDGESLRLYTTTIPTEHRIPTLMHDPQYRLSIAWQNVVYNKPPHPGFFLGEGMAPPTRPKDADGGKVLVGYLYRRAEKINFELYTHLCHAFLVADEEGKILPKDGVPSRELTGQAHRAGVKVLLSLGGWGWDQQFATMTTKPEAEDRYVKSVMGIVDQFDYDGLDLDWEYPDTDEEVVGFERLARRFRKQLDAIGKRKGRPMLQTMAVSANSGTTKWLSNEILLETMDWLNVMTYDFAGTWTPYAGHHSPLHASSKHAAASLRSTELTMKYLVQQRGLPADRLAVGIPLYGRGFAVSAPYASTKDAPDIRIPGGSYSNLFKLQQEEGWTRQWDDETKNPWLVAPDRSAVIGYDDEESVSIKTDWAMKQGFRGVLFWQIAADRLPDGANPLQEAARKKWQENVGEVVAQ